jgi:SAM-dependent methyltransferase
MKHDKMLEKTDPPVDMETPTYLRTRSAWERIWRETDLARELQTAGYARARRAQSLFLPHLPAGDRILEAGCGLGKELVSLQRQGHRAFGIDYARNALVRLHADHPGFRLTEGDIHRLPYPEAAFGAYLSFGVLEHFEWGPAPALVEANRVLRLGGTLVLTIPYPNLVWKLARMRKGIAPHQAPTPTEYYETTYTVRQLEESAMRAGFTVLEAHPIGHSFTLWGLGRPFRGPGYYETSRLAEGLGEILRRLLPWSMCFESLVIGRKSRSL